MVLEKILASKAILIFDGRVHIVYIWSLCKKYLVKEKYEYTNECHKEEAIPITKIIKSTTSMLGNPYMNGTL